MSIRTLIVCLAAFVCYSATAQNKPERIVYATKDTSSLWFDHYKPVAASNGISVLFVHGGSFTGGDPVNQYPMAEGLSKLGYRVFVIKYRLYLRGKSFGCNTPVNEKLTAIRWAAEDAMSATQYLLDHARELNVDSSKLFISGSSAGAEAILNTVYNPFGKTNDPLYNRLKNFKYTGALSFAGALIDMNTIKADNWIPLFLMHGTNDQLVPFKTAAHHYCSAVASAGWLMLFGSHTIYKEAQLQKLPAILYSFEGNGHEVSNYMFRKFREMDDFMQAVVKGKKIEAQEIIQQKQD